MPLQKIIYLTLITVTILSCHKTKKNAFIKGRLVNDCSKEIITDQKLFLFDTNNNLLETTTSDKSGLFWFFGKNYTDKNTVSLKDASIRLENGTKLAEGILGKGRGYTSGDTVNQNMGDLYLNGITFEITVNLQDNDNGIYYDSIIWTDNYTNGNYLGVLKNPINGYFTKTLENQTGTTKNFSKSSTNPQSQNLKFYKSNTFHYYKNGTTNLAKSLSGYYSPCRETTKTLDF